MNQRTQSASRPSRARTQQAGPFRYRSSSNTSSSSSTSRGSSSGSRPRFNTSRGASSSRTRAPQARGKRRGQVIDVARFINKPTGELIDVTAYVPTHTFADFPFSDALSANIARQGFTIPTAIQDQAIMPIIEGRDVVGMANTGTGKTATFLLPLIDKILKNRKEKVIIVAPTRELALQIEKDFRSFTEGMRLYSIPVIGGMPIYKQITSVRRGFDVIIGTPGRIKDLLDRRVLDLSNVRNVVLDEADQMLDMGFINDVRKILSHMPADRQTLFFSATLSREIEKLINEFLREPVSVSVKTRETAATIHQDIVRVVDRQKKFDVLHDLLMEEKCEKVLIFGETKRGVEKLSILLSKRGFKAESIHGDKSQSMRKRALTAFREDKINILVATDVAARGLDIKDISHVINFDLPQTYEDYVHRIGRTGRAGKSGKAITFVE